MRGRLLTAAVVLMFFQVDAPAANQAIDAPIKKVTVYLDQARIVRETHRNFPAGDHTLIFEQIPEGALESSFRVSASGVKGITILGLSHKQVQHLESPEVRIAELQKQINTIEHRQRQVLADRLASLTEQRNLVISVSHNAGDQLARRLGEGNLTVGRWDEACQYVGRKLLELDDSIRAVQERLDDVNNQLEKLNADLTNSRDPQTKSSRTVQVDLRLDQPGDVLLALEYMVPGASWQPLYDARLIGDSGTVEFSYNAVVSQHTGEDWKDVELTLSTATPSRGTGPGEFMPRYLSEFSPTPTILGAAPAAFGDAQIKGRILDQQTNEPVIGASVVVKGTNTGGQTDLDGGYAIRNVAPGTYSLVITAVGYASIEVTDVQTRHGLTTEINQRLETHPYAGKEVTVRATRDVISKFDVNSLISGSNAQIKCQPVQKVDELLRSVAGVRTTSSGEVFIRGGRAAEVGYIVDGVPVNDPFGGSGAGQILAYGGIEGTSSGGASYGPWNKLAAQASTDTPQEADVSSAFVSQGNYTSTFTTKRKETIPSGDESIRTMVAQWRLAGTLRVLTRPRDIDGAYRLVSIKNQKDAPLLPGRISVFVESDFLGNAQLNQIIVPNQTFDLPFGLDNNLSVTRKIWTLKKSESRDKTKVECTVKITVVNHAGSARSVWLEEPIPVSQDSRVKVELGEIAPKVTSIDESGRGVWALQINAGDSTIVTIPSRLEYPSGLRIVER